MTTQAKKVLQRIDSEGHMMTIGQKKGEVLAETVKDKDPKKILEIGTYVGYSAIVMADALEGNVEIVTLEVDPENANMAIANIKQAGYQDAVKVIVGDAKSSIAGLEGRFDLVFIDAVKEEYLTYLKLAEDKLEKGATVIADNVKVFKEGMRDYLEYVRESGKYKSETIDVGSDAVEVSVKL